MLEKILVGEDESAPSQLSFMNIKLSRFLDHRLFLDTVSNANVI
jgi:hypothetical protein